MDALPPVGLGSFLVIAFFKNINGMLGHGCFALVTALKGTRMELWFGHGLLSGHWNSVSVAKKCGDKSICQTPFFSVCVSKRIHPHPHHKFRLLSEYLTPFVF